LTTLKNSNQNFKLGYNNRSRYIVHESEVDMWIFTAKCLEIIGGTSMSLVCGRNGSGWRTTECQAVPEDGCSNWKRTSADGS